MQTTNIREKAQGAKRHTKYALLTMAGMILMGGHAIAQTDTTRSVYNESVIVVGDYNPVLDGVTEKVNMAPATNDNVAGDMQQHFSYNIKPRRISTTPSAAALKARKVLPPAVKLYNNYLRFGVGHDFAAFADINPMLDLYYMSLRDSNKSYGVRLFHETDVTTFGKKDETIPSPDYYGRTRESDTRVDLFGKYILKRQHLFSANLGFDRQYGRAYGFSDSTLYAVMGMLHDDLNYSDYAFGYNNIALDLGAQSLNTDVNRFGYTADMDMANFWSNVDVSQQSMALEGSVHYGFPMFRKYKAIAYLSAGWEGYKQHCIDYVSGDKVSSGRHLLNVNPYVDFLFKDFKIHAGLAFGFNGYDNDSETSHNLFPDITVSKSFMNNAMSLVVGFQGGYIVNDWNTLRQLNPYLGWGAFNTLATVDDNLFAHLRFNFSKKLILQVSADNHFYGNRQFFMTDPNDALQHQLLPYYVDVENLVLGADFTFVNDEMITLTLGANYYVYYNKQTDVPLFHVPDFTAHIDAKINYLDTWFFDLHGLFVTRSDAYYTVDGATGAINVSGQLPPHFGLGLGAEYKYNRAISFFAKLDNVTCQRYYLWANYPAQRFNLMLGLTYTIPTRK
jgi:hypothetical protein